MSIEPVSYERMVTTPDGANGTIGTPETVYTCSAEVTALKPSRTLEANQASLRQGYRLIQWATTRYTPRVGDTVTVNGGRYAIQGVRFTDATRRRIEIDVLETGNGE